MRKKILIISDHALTHSGVATQSRHLIEGLLNTEKFSVVQLGAAIKHLDYNEQQLTKDFKIIPMNNFGNEKIISSILEKEKPDVMIIFTDPRFFGHIFSMSKQIRKICPIMYWHVWDNRPTPIYNDYIYDSVDKIVAISRLTYSMCKENHRDKTVYIPHSLPSDTFYELPNNIKMQCKVKTLGENKKDNFIALWLNRNCKRKRPGDVLKAWQIFLLNLEDKFKRKDATLIMHTNPNDVYGLNLLQVAKKLNILDNVCFSDQIVDFEHINALHNISDICLNISYSEGFGLSTLESMQVGNPIIASQTGGLTNQVIDYNDGTKNGISLIPKVQVLAGNQNTLYVYEDYVSVEDTAKAIFDLYKMNSNDRKKLSNKCKKYVKKEFNYEKMINSWEEEIEKTMLEWKSNYDN